MDTLDPKQFCRVTSNFVDHALLEKNCFDDVFCHLEEMMDKEVAPKLDKSSGYTKLRHIVRDNIMFGQDSNAVSHYNNDTFPGPMAVQLCRTSLNKLEENEYYITEKSDGIRAMLLMICNTHFPRWVYDDDNTEQFPLLTNSAIECTYKHAKSQGKDFVCTIDRLPNTKFEYKCRTDTVHLVDTTNNNSRRLRRLKGWCFSFLFDRTYEFFLCLEEIAFPAPQTLKQNLKRVEDVNFHKVLILDGEIVYNLGERRNNYTIYDVVTCTNEMDKTQSFTKESMTNRIRAIKKLINEPHYYYYKEVLHKQPPKTLKLYLKHFYKKQDLLKVLECIKKDPKTGEYTYKGFNKNDGLIFTPNDSKLSAVKPGSNEFLLKWKWPNKLTCDFLVVPISLSKIASQVTATNDTETNLFYFYFYHKGNPVYYDAIQIKAIPEEVFTKICTLREQQGIIAECGYDALSQQWYFVLVREDKTTGNAYKTVANTIENTIENVTVDDLKHYMLDVSDSTKYQQILTQRKQILKDYEQEVADSRCYVFFKLVHFRGALSLNYKIGDTTEWRSHCEAEPGNLNFDGIRNHHEKFVEAFFDPFLGTYRLTRFVNVDANYCTTTKLLQNLLKMAHISAKVMDRYSTATSSDNEGSSSNIREGSVSNHKDVAVSSSQRLAHEGQGEYEPKQKKMKQ